MINAKHRVLNRRACPGLDVLIFSPASKVPLDNNYIAELQRTINLFCLSQELEGSSVQVNIKQCKCST